MNNFDQCQEGNKDAFEWDYEFQNSWNCFCNVGLHQSPISIKEGNSKQISKSSLSFKYIPVPKVKAIPKNSYEIELFGQFGQLNYQNPEKQSQIFEAYRISFKFPSEHRINGKEYPLEIVIYHKMKNGLEEAALSVLVTDDIKGTADLNKFIEDIDYHTWNFDEEVTLIHQPNLKNLVLLNDADYRRSFFSYMGSHTTLPCNENVERFILKKPLKIPLSQLQGLKLKSIKRPNARLIKPSFETNVVVYFNKGEKVVSKDKQLAQEIKSKVQEKLEKNRKKFFPAKYAKVSSTTSDYIVFFSSYFIFFSFS